MDVRLEFLYNLKIIAWFIAFKMETNYLTCVCVPLEKTVGISMPYVSILASSTDGSKVGAK